MNPRVIVLIAAVVVVVAKVKGKPTESEYKKLLCIKEADRMIETLETCVWHERAEPYVPDICVRKWDIVERFHLDVCKCVSGKYSDLVAEFFVDNKVCSHQELSADRYGWEYTERSSWDLSDRENEQVVDAERRFKQSMLDNGLADEIPEDHEESSLHPSYAERQEEARARAEQNAEEMRRVREDAEEQRRRDEAKKEEQRRRDEEQAEKQRKEMHRRNDILNKVFIVFLVFCIPGFIFCNNKQ